EEDVLDALGDGALRQELADRLCRLDVGAGLQAAAQILLDGRGGGDGLALRVVDDLRIDVLGRAEHREARPSVRRRTEGAADQGLASLESCPCVCHGMCPLCGRRTTSLVIPDAAKRRSGNAMRRGATPDPGPRL